MGLSLSKGLFLRIPLPLLGSDLADSVNSRANPSGSNFNILTEGGDNLVAEDGSPIVTEDAP